MSQICHRLSVSGWIKLARLEGMDPVAKEYEHYTDTSLCAMTNLLHYLINKMIDY